MIALKLALNGGLKDLRKGVERNYEIFYLFYNSRCLLYYI